MRTNSVNPFKHSGGVRKVILSRTSKSKFSMKVFGSEPSVPSGRPTNLKLLRQDFYSKPVTFSSSGAFFSFIAFTSGCSGSILSSLTAILCSACYSCHTVVHFSFRELQHFHPPFKSVHNNCCSLPRGCSLFLCSTKLGKFRLSF